VSRNPVQYVASEESSDAAAVRASLRPVLIASKSTLVEQSTFLRHLLVGLMDEPISTTLICPPERDIESIVPAPVAVLPHPIVDLPLMEHFGIDRLAAQLAKLKPTILHSLSEDQAPLARRLAHRLDLPYVQTVNSLAKPFPRIPISPRWCASIAVPAQTIGARMAKAYPQFADRIRQINTGTFIEEDTVCFSDPSRLPSVVLAQPLQRVAEFEAFFGAVKGLLADGHEFMVVLMGSGPAERPLRRLLARLGLSQTVTIVPLPSPFRWM
jgi:hypothetical protein